MNDIPTVVFSNSLTSPDWPETTVATGELAEAVARLKQERSGGYLLNSRSPAPSTGARRDAVRAVIEPIGNQERSP